MRIHESGAIADSLIRRLASFGALSDTETAFLKSLSPTVERRSAGEELARAGARAGRPRCLVSGWACCLTEMADGRRQIFRFILPGDSIALSGDRDGGCPGSIVALTQVQTVDAAPLRELMLNRDRHPLLLRALEAAIAQDTALLQDQIIRLGRLTAVERLAHLLLELRSRLAVVGMATERRMPLPLTQEVLADALGLSNVHLNRSLQQLRREQLIELKGGNAVLLEPEILASLCQYQGRSRHGGVAAAGRGESPAADRKML